MNLETCHDWDIWSKWWEDMTWPKNLPTHLPTYLPVLREHPKGAIIGTCDIWDTDYNTDNWEPGCMTIFVTWQLIVTLDSISNSCDVSTIAVTYSVTQLLTQWVTKGTYRAVWGQLKASL